MLRGVVALLGVTALVLAMPPHPQPLVAWVGLSLVVGSVGGWGRRMAIPVGWGIATLLFMVLGSWFVGAIAVFGNMPVWVAGAMTCVIVALMALPHGIALGHVGWLERRWGRWWPVGFGLAYAIAGWLAHRTAVVPPSLGLSQLDWPWVTACLALGGEPLLDFWMGLTCAAGCEVVRRREVVGLGVAGVFSAVLLGFGALWSGSFGVVETLNVGLVQSAFTVTDRMERASEVRDWWRDAAGWVPSQTVDLVVIPESALVYDPGTPEQPSTIGSSLAEQSVAFDRVVGLGRMVRDPAGGPNLAFNQALLFSDGRFTLARDKSLPMPLAEAFPFESWMPGPLVDFNASLVGDFQTGDRLFGLAGRKNWGVAICYELMSARHMWGLSDTDVLIGIANDSWYGDTRAPHLSAGVARFRSIEAGKTLVRVGFSGGSFVAQPDGTVSDEGPRFVERREVVQVGVRRRATPYGLLGDWVVGLGAGVLIFVGWRSRPVAVDPSRTA